MLMQVHTFPINPPPPTNPGLRLIHHLNIPPSYRMKPLIQRENAMIVIIRLLYPTIPNSHGFASEKVVAGEGGFRPVERQIELGVGEGRRIVDVRLMEV